MIDRTPWFWDPVYIIYYMEPGLLFEQSENYYHKTQADVERTAQKMSWNGLTPLRINKKDGRTGRETTVKNYEV